MNTPPAAQEAPALTPATAQELLGISRRTLMRWEARGYITARRLPSGHRRFDRAEVLALRDWRRA